MTRVAFLNLLYFAFSVAHGAKHLPFLSLLCEKLCWNLSDAKFVGGRVCSHGHGSGTSVRDKNMRRKKMKTGFAVLTPKRRLRPDGPEERERDWSTPLGA